MTQQGKYGQHILLTVEHILLTIITFSVVIKVLVTCNLPSTGKRSFSKYELNVPVSLSRRCGHNQKETNSYMMQWSIILLVAGIENGKQEKCASNVQIVTFLVAVFHVIVLGGSFCLFLKLSKGGCHTFSVRDLPSAFG